MKTRVLLGMSGGVDSSVAALLLKQEGYEVVGITLNLVPDKFADQTDTSAQDASQIAQLLGIEHHIVDMQDKFNINVMADFAEKYLSGKTPNPCIVCNKTIKFGEMMALADKLGCEKLATGHYAQCVFDNASGNFLLKKSPHNKDQSYFLYTLSQDVLKRVILPLGTMTKQDVRAIAEKHNLPTSSKRDSQDICFVKSGGHAEFIEKYLSKKFPKGNFIDENGKVLGEHKGIIHYTIGQRKGLGIALGEPKFVTEIDAQSGFVTLGNSESLMSDSLTVNSLCFTTDFNKTEFDAKVKIRFAAPPTDAVVTILENERAKIKFVEKQRAITPGQSAVFYDGDTVIGGGEIE
ncbi:MAG: tRNA 2-thiouridine(34) synthase MnmA [Clostridia bacterium]|nr:tRNA 2-thiouridine(34) synthase MnmA [Clostridia bacterium]